MGHWGFVAGAYAIVLAVVLGYACWTERAIRALERGPDAGAPARPRR